ncbi:MAG: hypothetical protein CO128_03230 [Ignavibacteriales bacterium CG_4_9_14_3_um_filter_30_11]|nr:MAG: hypothetical protein CO128_03230 [Ignavibacteriales bacterium CG_4_9_14_3_um_filter_30_11]
MQKIAEDLISKFDEYLLSIKNCENIKKLKYKTDLDFVSLLFRVVAKQIIEEYVSQILYEKNN